MFGNRESSLFSVDIFIFVLLFLVFAIGQSDTLLVKDLFLVLFLFYLHLHFNHIFFLPSLQQSKSFVEEFGVQIA